MKDLIFSERKRKSINQDKRFVLGILDEVNIHDEKPIKIIRDDDPYGEEEWEEDE